MGLFSKFVLGGTRGRAERVYKAFKPTDLEFVYDLLDWPRAERRGFTPEMAYALSKRYPDVADRIIARAKR